MNKSYLLVSVFVLTSFASMPVAVGDDDLDDLDVTMQVLDGTEDIDFDISPMRGPEGGDDGSDIAFGEDEEAIDAFREDEDGQASDAFGENDDEEKDFADDDAFSEERDDFGADDEFRDDELSEEGDFEEGEDIDDDEPDDDRMDDDEAEDEPEDEPED